MQMSGQLRLPSDYDSDPPEARYQLPGDGSALFCAMHSSIVESHTGIKVTIRQRWNWPCRMMVLSGRNVLDSSLRDKARNLAEAFILLSQLNRNRVEIGVQTDDCLQQAEWEPWEPWEEAELLYDLKEES